MSSVGELFLTPGSGLTGEAGARRASERAARPVRGVSRLEFIERCTTQSLVVWRGAASFAGAPARSADRVHSAVSHEGAHAPVDDRLARPAVVSDPHRGS